MVLVVNLDCSLRIKGKIISQCTADPPKTLPRFLMLLQIRSWNNSPEEAFVGFLFSDKLVVCSGQDSNKVLFEYSCEDGSVFRCFSPDESKGRSCNSIAIGCSNKKVLIVQQSDSTCTLSDHFTVPKTITSIVFNEQILVAENSGNVHCYDAKTKAFSCLLGHLSIVTDICLSLEKNLIFSADKDQKIRVSRFPESFVIEKFLLGHESFISRIASSPNGELLVSGGGDAFLCLWNIPPIEGEKVSGSMQKIAIEFAPEDLTEKICVVALAFSEDEIWVAFEHSCTIYRAEKASGWTAVKPCKKLPAFPVSIALGPASAIWIGARKENDQFILKNFEPFLLKGIEVEDSTAAAEAIQNTFFLSWEKLCKKLGNAASGQSDDEAEENPSKKPKD